MAKQDENEELNYLKQIIALIPGNIYWKNKDGVYLGCNDNVRQIFKKFGDTIVGKTNYDFMSKEEADELATFDESVFAGGKPKSREEIGYDKYGEKAMYLSDKIPLRNQRNEIVGLIGIAMDITELKAKEKALQEAKEGAEAANRSKSDFLAMMSHELRTPLNAIMGMAQILKGYKFSKEQQEYIDIIFTSGKNLLTLINDILDFTKLEAGRLEFTSESFGLREVIEETVTSLSVIAREKDLDLLVDYEYDVPTQVCGDAGRVRQIIVNLLNNAIKFTKHGNILIAVNYVGMHDDQIVLQIAVTDTGMGIPKGKLDVIFERFTQVKTEEHRKYDGVGLGLAITKQLVETMGGTISVHSQEGCGTTFYCDIPFVPVDESTTISDILTDEQIKQLNILIIDDNAIRSKVLSHQLINDKTKALPGKEALKVIDSVNDVAGQYDVVILDQQITSATSQETIKRIRQNKYLENSILVMLIEPTSLPKKRQLLMSGVNSLLVKPVQATDLNKAIVAQLAKRNEHMVLSEEINFTGTKILLIEDNEVSQQVAAMMLKSFGCKVSVASTGAQALALLENTFDLIFIDISLPDISGIEIVERYLAKHPDNKMPFIALTAHVAKADQQECLDAGINEVMTKPLFKEKLIATLNKYIAK